MNVRELDEKGKKKKKKKMSVRELVLELSKTRKQV
jgi:hypothetical protein